MGVNEKLGKTAYLNYPQLTNVADKDMFAFISRLIDQNAELMQKIQELDSWKKVADEIAKEVEQKANVLSLLAEKEVNRRVDNIINDAKEKAKGEADRIIAEATLQADRIIAEATLQAESIGIIIKDKQANDRAAEMRAKIEADKILAEAKRKAEDIVEDKTRFETQGLLIINKVEERGLSVLKDVQKQAKQITGKANQKPRG
jgi:vacuolar-type H+-ATPase subunit H